MTTLTAPPLVAERQTSNHDCGPAALASVLAWCGVDDSERGVAEWMSAKGIDTSGTSAAGLAEFCAAYKIPCSWDNVQPLAFYVSGALARGHLVVALHQCDGNANPVPVGRSKTAHWRVVYGNDGDNYATMNPWPPNLDAVSYAALQAADLRSHIEVNLPGVSANPLPLSEDMLVLFVAPIKPTGAAVFVSNGMRFRHVMNPADLADVEGVGTWFNGAALKMWANGAPVNDPLAFGNPDDAATAALCGLPFTVGAPSTAGGDVALSAAQAAALAQIPAIASALAAGDLTLAHIETALKSA